MTFLPITEKNSESVQESSIANKRVALIYVGGTVGMVRNEQGQYAPKTGFVEELLSSMPELSSGDMPIWKLYRLDPLLDSANMGPAEWVRMAEMVVTLDRDFDAFVILHGTDTMVYSASALSFLLEGLQKPVIMTGSQLSLDHARSDGREHIITSLILAGSLNLPEVAIYFASDLLRGNRAQKVHNEDFVAFASGNLSPLARVGIDIRVNQHLIRKAGSGLPKKIEMQVQPKIASLRLFPGLDGDMLRAWISSSRAPLDAVVLETYGAGNAPSNDKAFLRAIEDAVEAGVIVVNCSQCHGGRVRAGEYESGSYLQKAGVVSGHDMTPEAALTKLYCLFGRGESREQIRERMTVDLAGELTTPEHA